MSFDLKSVGKSFRFALLLIILAEAISFWGFLFPSFSSVAMVVTCVLVFILAFIRYDLALLVLLAELFIGSQGGYLFTFGLEGGLSLSLRMGLFLAIFGAWAIKTVLAIIRRLRKQDDYGDLSWLTSMKETGILWPYLGLLVIFAFSAVRGLISNGFGDMFFDANGYAFFAILPAIVAGFRDLKLSPAVGVLFAAVAASVLKALFVFYVFSHRMLYVASPIYIWIRDTRVGEITIMTGDFYRIFFQAHLFGLLLAVVGTAIAAYAISWRSNQYRCPLMMISWVAVALVLGLSRSFWFGVFFGALTLTTVFIWSKAKASVWKRTFVLAMVAVVVAITVLVGTYAIPFPKKGAEFSLASLLGNRVTSLDDSAANSRWALLPILNKAGMVHPILGSGFGTRVEYQTSDPRTLADNPDGLYSTYSFEWGYHDLWLKIGLIGLIVYGWFLYALMRPIAAIVRKNRAAYQSSEAASGKMKAVVSLGLLAAIIALLATNIFSPYLNHPLGIGTLAILAGWNARNFNPKSQS